MMTYTKKNIAKLTRSWMPYLDSCGGLSAYLAEQIKAKL